MNYQIQVSAEELEVIGKALMTTVPRAHLELFDKLRIQAAKNEQAAAAKAQARRENGGAKVVDIPIEAPADAVAAQ